MKPTHWIDFAGRYLAHAKEYKAPATVRCADKPAVMAFSEFISNPPLAEITISQIDDWRLLRLTRYAQNYVRLQLSILHVVFQYAMSLDLIFKNPVAFVKLPKQVFTGRRLTDDELKRILPLLSPSVRRACILSLYTGLRIGEVLGLEWCQILGGYLIVPANKAKSGRERSILLHPVAIRALGKTGTGYVFEDLTRTTINKELSQAAQFLGLGDFNFHTMRHTWATKFMEQSKDTGAAMDAGGWASERSMRPYQHVTPLRQREILKIRYSF